jgi:hypothetical protein
MKNAGFHDFIKEIKTHSKIVLVCCEDYFFLPAFLTGFFASGFFAAAFFAAAMRNPPPTGKGYKILQSLN